MPVSGWNRDGSARKGDAAEDHLNEKEQRLLEFYCCCKWHLFLVM